jgi:PAS domain S-box-containing protein
MKKRFKTYLMITIIFLVTGSVTVLSAGLYLYIGSRMKSEFNENMEAYKGRVEIILNNRFGEIASLVQSISMDNAVRFTTQKGNSEELEQLLKNYTEKNPSIYFFVKNKNNFLISPTDLANFPTPIQEMDTQKPRKEIIFENHQSTRLLWNFETPITDSSEAIGTVYALYDLFEDRQLTKEMGRTAPGGILINLGKELVDLEGSKIPDVDPRALKKDLLNKKAMANNLVLSPLKGFDRLYYSLSQENLMKEKNGILFILIFFSLIILLVSTGLSLFLGRQMSRPLSEMASMAIQISRGEKDLSFAEEENDYLEFNQLSQAFNYMLAALNEAEEKSRFTELLENVDDAVYLTDEKGRLLNANEATYKSLNHSPDSFFKLTLFDILPLEDARMVLDHFHTNSSQEDAGQLTFETHLVKKDKNRIPVEIKSRAIHYSKGKAILNVARDVTRRLEAQKILRESEEQYRSLIETSHNGILILDDDFKIFYANNRLCRILGYSRKELNEIDFTDMIGQHILQSAREQNLLIDSENDIQPPVEIKIIRKDGEERHCYINITAMKDSSRETIRMVVQILDITDQFRAEQEKTLLESHLRQSQKMEAIGNLAGGIAHDFNNLLQIILGYTEILMFTRDKDDPEHQKLFEVKQATERATELTRQLLTFSRKLESDMRPTDLNSEVTQIANLLKRTLPRSIEIELDLAKGGLPTINGDASQLGQLIMNLSVNARDAMPDGGKLTIKTGNRFLDKKFCESPEGAGILSGRYACLSISDTGTGMNQQCLEHIYEPFFTTKEVGKGTGLGLAIVYGIINSHKGHIVCKSRLGEGTTFDVYLPAMEARLPSNDGEPEDIPFSGSETLLLVDDDETVRNLGSEMLSKIGHKVMTAESGENAIKAYSSGKDEIDLIILDLLMPGMGGHKCLEGLLKLNPDVKVLIASGHAGKEPAHDKILTKAKGFVYKPYKMNEMSEAIRRIMDDACT